MTCARFLALCIASLGLLVPACTSPTNTYRTPVRPFAFPLSTGGPSQGGGLFWTYYKAPITTDFKSTPARPPKVGSSSATYFIVPFGLSSMDFAFGAADLETAAARGGIEKIHYADHEFLSVLGLFSIYTTVVYGE
jgi:hypothetical protein